MTAPRTKIDWLAGRTRSQPAVVLEGLRAGFGAHGELLNLDRRLAGWMGYDSSAEVRVGNMHVGRLAWGGEHQRGWVHASITGKGCDWVEDWDALQDGLQALQAWEPRRVDIALDTFGRECTHEKVLQAHRDGGFTTRGRPPALSQIIHEDPTVGRTIYIGKRTSEKFVRAYEKGLQLAAGPVIDGVPAEDWYRVELECKVKDNPLPADIIDRRDQYLAGSYPYLQQLLPNVHPEILVSMRERAPQLDLAAALENVRVQYGRTLFTAMVAYGGDISAVWGKVCARQHNEELLRSGVLLVEHA